MAAALLGLAGSSITAAGAADATVATTEGAKGEAVPAADIPLRADADERLIQDLARRARQRDPSVDLEKRLDTLRAGINALANSYTADELERLSVIRLESIERHWQFYQHELEAWRHDLDRVTAPYSASAASLAERHAVWEATRESLADSGVASALGERVAGILAQLRAAEQALSGPLEAQIRLGRRANTVQANIEAGRKVIDSAIESHDRRLWTSDAPPVWKAWQDSNRGDRGLREAHAGMQTERAFLHEWFDANRNGVNAFVVAALSMLALLLWTSWRSRDVSEAEDGGQAAAHVLHRPISAWLVLVLVGLPFLFPDSPLMLAQIALLLALIPVLRLLPPRLYELLGVWPYVVTALYVAYRLSFLLLGEPVLYRLYLLAVALVNAGALVWLLLSRRRDGKGMAAQRLRGGVRLVGWLAVATLLAGISANVLGNVALGEMLTGAVLDSVYIGFALFAGATVLSSVVNLVLTQPLFARFHVVTQHAGPLLAAANRLLVLAAVVVWLIVTANEFRVARPVVGWLKAVLTHPLEVGEISISLGGVLLFLFAVWTAFWIAKTVRLVLHEEVLPKMALPRGVDNSISTLTYYAVVIVGLMIALAAAGFETSQFAIVFGALGVGIGFGLQNIVNNFVSGLILMFERPIQPGDSVELAGTAGTVREIGMRATTLTTGEGADVVVPNGTLLSEKLVNWTLRDMNRRIDVEVGVAYGADPRRVIELLREVAVGTPGIAANPAPAVVFTGLGASSLDFVIRAWTNQFGNWVTIRTEMTARVYEALQREGIEIPFPQQDLHLRSVSPEAARLFATAATVKRGDQASTDPQC